jgi:hypothetical protein
MKIGNIGWFKAANGAPVIGIVTYVGPDTVKVQTEVDGKIISLKYGEFHRLHRSASTEKLENTFRILMGFEPLSMKLPFGIGQPSDEEEDEEDD